MALVTWVQGTAECLRGSFSGQDTETTGLLGLVEESAARRECLRRYSHVPETWTSATEFTMLFITQLFVGSVCSLCSHVR